MKNSKGMGVVEIILVLAILVILVLLFRDKIMEFMAWLYRCLLEAR